MTTLGGSTENTGISSVQGQRAANSYREVVRSYISAPLEGLGLKNRGGRDGGGRDDGNEGAELHLERRRDPEITMN